MEVSFVKRYIDLLSFLKMNVLHWHLVDDQGWRIEIKKYPKLTEMGAFRNGYGGFYSQDEVKEIVAYSKTKFVQIIPEIEMPGHCVSSLASYPHLSCFPDQQYNVETEWGVFKDVYCAGKESTFEFLENVLKEVMELFDSPFIHLGGDECPKENWEKCESCQKRIIEEKLKNEEELQHYFMKRMCLFLLKFNKTVIGWDEILEGGETLSFPENVVIQSWRGMVGAIEASKKNISSVVSPTSHCYFDYGLDAIDLKKVYSFNPVPHEGMMNLVLGGECNMWSERAPQELVDSKVFPRILAMAEVLWSNSEKNYKKFHERVKRFYKILDIIGVEYGDESTPIQMEVTTTLKKEELISNVKLIPGGKSIELLFSFDGENFVKFEKEFQKNGEFLLFVKAMKNGKQEGEIEKKRVFRNLILNKSYAMEYLPSPTYPGISLTNGNRGPMKNFRDAQWMGFINHDLEIQFEDISNVKVIRVGCLNDTNSWIFFPFKIELLLKKNEKFEVIEEIFCQELKELSKKDFEFNRKIEFAKELKIIVKRIECIPEWHNGKGSPAWIFVDQIEME
jgi:hexosaminidase